METLLIALVDGISTQHAILLSFGMNAISISIEYFVIACVDYELLELRSSGRVTGVPAA